jgi:hypothetical protein
MSDLTTLNENYLWHTACRFAKLMFKTGDSCRDKYLSNSMQKTALRLVTAVTESHECDNPLLAAEHIALAEAYARELSHYLALAERSRELPPHLLNQAMDSLDELWAEFGGLRKSA